MDFTIRKAKLSDAKGMVRLYLQFWEPHKGVDPLLEPDKRPTLKNQIELAKKDIKKKNSHIFVAVKDNKIIGLIGFLIKKNEDCLKIKKYGLLDFSVTDKKHRRKGVAKGLTRFGFKFLRDKGIKYVRIKVYNKNKAAFKAWQRLGFKPQSIHMIKRL